MRVGIKELVFFVVMVGLLGCSWYFVFNQAERRRTTLSADMRAKQTALENLRQSTSGIADLEKKLTDLEKAISFFDSKLPKEKDVDAIVDSVWRMAESNRLQCKTFKPLKIERGTAYSEQPIELSLEGDFDGFYEFLLQLEKLPRITRATRMDLSKIDAIDGAMSAKLTVVIFFESDTPPAPAATVTSAR